MHYFSGEWKIFNGNEIGALLGWWCLENWKSKNGTDLRFVYMIASTVSSKILTRMSDIEGFMCDVSLVLCYYSFYLKLYMLFKNYFN